jgi:hypothetical protein
LVSRREQFSESYNFDAIADWGRIGVTFITNLCNSLTDSFLVGLLIRWLRVRLSRCPSCQTSADRLSHQIPTEGLDRECDGTADRYTTTLAR